MRIKDRDFVPFISREELDSIVSRLAEEVSRDYVSVEGGEIPVVCPILTGAYMFAADLLRKLTMPCEVRFVRYTSYSGMNSTGDVKCGLPFPAELTGRDVLIVEDVVDSGLSMQYMLDELRKMNPRSVRICALLFKPHAFKGNYKVDYVGREIGDDFIVGYGMDYDEQGRTLGEIWKVKSVEC